MKKLIKKFTASISLFLCFAVITNSVSAFAFNGIQALKPNAIATTSVHGIVAGESIQLYSSSNSEGTPDTDGIWSSSNSNVISCTPNGYITGIKAGDSADITCTSKSDGTSKTFTVYCVNSVYPQQRCTTKSFRTMIYAQPNNDKPISIHLNLNTVWNFFSIIFKALASLGIFVFPSSDSISVISSGNFTVYGQYGNYAYIRFNEEATSDGFIKYTDLSKKINSFLYLSDSSLVLKPDTTEHLKVDYPGSVLWTVENDSVDDKKTDYENSIIKFDPSTGKITAKKGGITSITASANGMVQTCKIYSIYMWPQEWKVKATEDITLYELPGIVDRNYEIYEGDTFYVVGDLGGSYSWCYINRGSDLFPEYSYAKIEDFSTKGTISQYNELGWSWPVKNVKNNIEQSKKANYIYSPYGWRDDKPKRHQGIDITTGTSGEIAGYDVVSAFNGTVIYRGDEYGYDWGYCVAIRSDCVDPISGKNFVAVYMHLMDEPKVYEGTKVVAGTTVLGKVGNTTTPGIDMGYHLHFEFNNQGSSIGVSSDGSQTTDYGRKSYDYLVNPIFLYIDEYEKGEISYNKTSASELKYFKTFWYGNGDEIEEAY